MWIFLEPAAEGEVPQRHRSFLSTRLHSAGSFLLGVLQSRLRVETSSLKAPVDLCQGDRGLVRGLLNKGLNSFDAHLKLRLATFIKSYLSGWPQLVKSRDLKPEKLLLFSQGKHRRIS